MISTRTRILAGGALLALSLTACAGGGDAPAETPADGTGGLTLVTPGSLTMCTNPPFEPFEFADDSGEIVGIDPAIVGEVANDLGLQLVVLEAGFDGIESGAVLESGQCDVVASGITITEGRKANLDFSAPYFDADQGLLVAEDSGITGLDGLAGGTVAVQVSTTGETFAQENGLATVQFEDLGLQVQALRTGQVTGVINDIAVLGTWATDGLEIAATFPTGEQYGIGVKKGNTALLEAVDATLERIKADGTWAAIYERYVGVPPTES